MNYEEAKQHKLTLREITKDAHNMLQNHIRVMGVLGGGTTIERQSPLEYKAAQVAYSKALLEEVAANLLFEHTFKEQIDRDR